VTNRPGGVKPQTAGLVRGQSSPSGTLLPPLVSHSARCSWLAGSRRCSSTHRRSGSFFPFFREKPGDRFHIRFLYCSYFFFPPVARLLVIWLGDYPFTTGNDGPSSSIQYPPISFTGCATVHPYWPIWAKHSPVPPEIPIAIRIGLPSSFHHQ